MEQTNTTNIVTENGETTNVYLTDSEDKYLLDKLGVYLTTTDKKEDDIMATKKYVSLEKLGLYDEKIKKVITDGDAASLQSAKDYADSLADNYEKAGTIATAKQELEGKIGTAQAAADAAAEAAAKAQGEVDALELVVGTLPEGSTSVVEYVNKKTEGIATDTALAELQGAVDAVEADVATIKGDYLTSANETALNDAITAEANRAKGIEGGLETRLAAVEGDYLKTADKTTLQGAIDGVAEDVATISGDYLNAADKTELQGKIDAKASQTDLDAEVTRATNAEANLQTQINTIMNNPDAEGAINSINEFTAYVTEHGAIADGFRTDIDKNKGDIAAEVKRAGEAEAALDGRLNTLESIDHDAYIAADTALKNELTTEIGKKADASVVSDMDAAYKAADKALSERLDAALGNGDGSVSDMISDAVSAEATRVDGLLENKVDKVTGKGLSTNDLTNELKANYDAAYTHSTSAHAPVDAQANIIESVKVNGAALTVTDKAVNIAVPTDNAELTNGAGYLVANDIANKADKATTLTGYGIADAYTKTETDTAITNAIGQFVECSEEEINNLFK